MKFDRVQSVSVGLTVSFSEVMILYQEQTTGDLGKLDLEERFCACIPIKLINGLMDAHMGKTFDSFNGPVHWFNGSMFEWISYGENQWLNGSIV